MVDREALFMSKIADDSVSGCWLWTGYITQFGYGQFFDGSKVVGAHVYSYRIFVGERPEGLDLDHLCRVRHCVCPDHLEAVTRRENLLRGKTIPARKAAQTHCGNGHPLSGDNLYLNKNGTRACRICRADKYAEWVNSNRERRREIDREAYRRRIAR